MESEYIEKGRFDYPVIWIGDFHPLLSYPDSAIVGLRIGEALELWKVLTKSLVEAGQAGTLDAGTKEFIK